VFLACTSCCSVLHSSDETRSREPRAAIPRKGIARRKAHGKFNLKGQLEGTPLVVHHTTGEAWGLDRGFAAWSRSTAAVPSNAQGKSSGYV
jgi:hypothetical protein